MTTSSSASSAAPASVTPAWEPRVLVVDDDELSRLAAQTLLQQLGLAVDLAFDGAEALEMSAGWPYVAIFMDCGMPNVDGYAATRGINRQGSLGRRVPVIAMTSHPRSICLAAGMDHFLAKPLQLGVLEHDLKQLGLLPRDRARPDEHFDDAHGTDTPLLEVPARGPIEPEDAVRIGQFAAYATARLPELWRATNAGDCSSIGRIAQEFRTRAAALGAVRIADLSDQMHKAAAEDDPGVAASLEPFLRQAVGDTVAAIEAYLHPSPDGKVTAPASADTESTGHEARRARDEVRVAVADDDALARLAIAAMIEAADGLALVGCAEGVEEIVELATFKRPDVVVLDWLMPDGGGPAAGRRIRAVSPGTVLVALTSSESDDARLEMVAAGATNLLVKGCSGEVLAHTVRHAFEARA